MIPRDLLLADIPPNKKIYMPANVRSAVQQVTTKVGLNNEDNLARIVGTLRDYFSAFEDKRIPGFNQEENIYLAIALSKKGVCRHRAFAFFVTANAIGVPTRYVVSKVHAFVEVFVPTIGWQRIDLGGREGDVLVDSLDCDQMDLSVSPDMPLNVFRLVEGGYRWRSANGLPISTLGYRST